SIISAVTCVLLAGIGSHVWNKRVGVVAGILAATYPGFIINSGRCVTETMASFLLSTAVWLIVRAINSRGGRLRRAAPGLYLAGAICGALELTRPVLMLVAPFMIPVALAQPTWTKRMQALAILAAGLATAVIPWMALQALSNGKPSPSFD